jgi:hypothetical protein
MEKPIRCCAVHGDHESCSVMHFASAVSYLQYCEYTCASVFCLLLTRERIFALQSCEASDPCMTAPHTFSIETLLQQLLYGELQREKEMLC